ncbi:hypothetical protein [Bacillus sp. Bos-x628]|uniref:hypothetical protein n=1 Tax=Bacillus maqinnsis TaxID=3229854 RepID=UPI00338F0179
MKILDTFHPAHYEALMLEKTLSKDFDRSPLLQGKGSTHKLYAFPNGYGASIINGFMTFGSEELAVIFFENPVKFYRSKKKRFRKKLIKQLGKYHVTYDTPITSNVKRYSNPKELQQDLTRISKLKGV